tara:strand:- start:43 stop:255 length:213 start_codon:yes stop_codon:yes gene_type:complete
MTNEPTRKLIQQELLKNSKQAPVFEAQEISYLMMVVPSYFTEHKKYYTKDGKDLHKQVWKKILDYRDFFN